jgi:predicted nucleotidyltransferase
MESSYHRVKARGRDEVLAILRAFKAERADEFGILELGLFGSVARGADRAESDVDVCIRMRTPDGFAMVHIRDELEARLGRRVDVVRVRQRMNPLLLARIEQDGIFVRGRRSVMCTIILKGTHDANQYCDRR